MTQLIIDTWNQMTGFQQAIIAYAPLALVAFVAYCKQEPIK